MIKVYHRGDGMFAVSSLVANVETDSLDAAFELTNHINNAWELNKRVTAYDKPNRSTSVGDLMVDTKDGGVYEVAGQGFHRLNPAEYPHTDQIATVAKAVSALNDEERQELADLIENHINKEQDI